MRGSDSTPPFSVDIFDLIEIIDIDLLSIYRRFPETNNEKLLSQCSYVNVTKCLVSLSQLTNLNIVLVFYSSLIECLPFLVDKLFNNRSKTGRSSK